LRVVGCATAVHVRPPVEVVGTARVNPTHAEIAGLRGIKQKHIVDRTLRPDVDTCRRGSLAAHSAFIVAFVVNDDLLRPITTLNHHVTRGGFLAKPTGETFVVKAGLASIVAEKFDFHANCWPLAGVGGRKFVQLVGDTLRACARPGGFGEATGGMTIKAGALKKRHSVGRGAHLQIFKGGAVDDVASMAIIVNMGDDGVGKTLTHRIVDVGQHCVSVAEGDSGNHEKAVAWWPTRVLVGTADVRLGGLDHQLATVAVDGAILVEFEVVGVRAVDKKTMPMVTLADAADNRSLERLVGAAAVGEK
jgi:hypothetical protein